MLVQVLLCLCGLAAAQHKVNLNQLVDSELKSLGKIIKYLELEPLRIENPNFENLGERYKTELEGVSVDSIEIHGLSTLERGGDMLMWTTEGGELHSTASLKLKNLTTDIIGLKRPGREAKSMRVQLMDLTTNVQEDFFLTDSTCKRNVNLEIMPISRASATDLDSETEIDLTENVNEKLLTHWKDIVESEDFKNRMERRGVCAMLGMDAPDKNALSNGRRSNKFNLNPLVDRMLEVVNRMLRLRDLQMIPVGDVREGTMKLFNMMIGDVSTMERRGDAWMRTMPDNVIELKLGFGLAKFEVKVENMEDEGTSTGPLSMNMRGPALMILAKLKITDTVQFDELDLQIVRVDRATIFRQGKGTDVTEMFNSQLSKLNHALQGELGDRINQLLRENRLEDLESAEVDKILDKYFTSAEKK